MDAEVASAGKVVPVMEDEKHNTYNEIDYVDGKIEDFELGEISEEHPEEFRVNSLDSTNKINENSIAENASSEDFAEDDKFKTHKRYENGDISFETGDECIEHSKYLDSFFIKKKRKQILNALANDDVKFLQEAAISTGGLLSDDIRQKVWPKLLGVDLVETSPRPTMEAIENHHYYRQVVLDVNRSLKRFPPSIKEAQRLAMLDQLVLLIMRVLCKHPQLHYYQGYHDICVTFLLVLGEETAYYVVEKISRLNLDIFMKESMEHTIDMLYCMYPLIGKKCPKLSQFLLKSEVGVAYCLSWLITWFGHVLNDYETVVRLFDFFLVSDPVMPLYLTSAVVLHRKEEVLQQDCDMASVHSLLSHIPDDLPFESLLVQSLELFEKHDYKTLKKESVSLTDSKPKIKRNVGLVQSIAKRIKSTVPASNFAVPFVIAAAVLVTAILYQAYKY